VLLLVSGPEYCERICRAPERSGTKTTGTGMRWISQTRGDMDSAYKWIDKAVEVRSTMLFWVLTGNSPLRKDSRFEEMKQKMGYRQ